MIIDDFSAIANAHARLFPTHRVSGTEKVSPVTDEADEGTVATNPIEWQLTLFTDEEIRALEAA